MSDKKDKKANAENPPEKTVGQTEEKSKKGKLPKEIGGRDGPEPTRYGDWENKGIASDF